MADAAHETRQQPLQKKSETTAEGFVSVVVVVVCGNRSVVMGDLFLAGAALNESSMRLHETGVYDLIF